jgi:3-dehydroquinate dehydratase-1
VAAARRWRDRQYRRFDFAVDANQPWERDVMNNNISKGLTRRGVLIGQGREPLICAPLVARQLEALSAEAQRVAAKQPDLIEWRVDFFASIAELDRVLAGAAAVREAAGTIPIIFTRRSTREGGEAIPIDEEQVVAMQAAVCASGFIDFIDCELSCAPDHFRHTLAAAKHSEVKLIASFHDFQRTPSSDHIVAKFGEAAAAGADIAKVAVMPRSLDDVLTLLDATQRGSREFGLPLITMSMGAYGVLTRMFGWMFGSSVSFAVGDRASAPGQVPIDDLRQVLEVLQRSLKGT